MALYKLTSRNDEKNLSVILETQNYRTIVLTEDNANFENILELLKNEEQAIKSTDEVEQAIMNLVDENQAIAKLMKTLDSGFTLGSYNKVLYKGHRLTYALQTDIYSLLRDEARNPSDSTKLLSLVKYVHKVYTQQENTILPDGVIEDGGVYDWLQEHGVQLNVDGNIQAVTRNIGNIENMVTHDYGIEIGERVLNRTLEVEDTGSFVIIPSETNTLEYTSIPVEHVEGMKEPVMTHGDFSNMTQKELLEYLQQSQQKVIQHLLNQD